MKIGITGCAGMLGSHLTELLLADGHEIVGIDNLDVGTLENIKDSHKGNNFTFFKFDAREKELVASVFIEFAILLAWEKSA